MYQKYTILGSKLTVVYHPTTLTGSGTFGVHLHKDGTALTDVNHYKELPITRQTTLTTQKDRAYIKQTYSGKRF